MSRSVSLPSLETQLQDSQELYTLLLSLTKQDENVGRVKEIQSGVMRNREEMEESRKKRLAVTGGTIWHNAIKPFNSPDIVYNWERFEDYSAMKPLPLDPKESLKMSLEGNEIQVPDKESSSLEGSGLFLPTLSNDGTSISMLNSVGSTITSLHVSGESMGNESFIGILNAMNSKAANGSASESAPSALNASASRSASGSSGSGAMSLTAASLSSINSVNGASSSKQNATGSPAISAADLNSSLASVGSAPNPTDRSNAPASIPVKPAPRPLTISTTNLSPPPSNSGNLSCGSPSSSVASAISPTICPILASPRLNMPGSSLNSPPQVRKKSVSTSVLVPGHSTTSSDNFSSPRQLPASISLSLNSPISLQPVKLSVPTASSSPTRQDSSRVFTGQMHIPFVQSHSSNPAIPVSGDPWPLSAENVSDRGNQNVPHRSSVSSDDSFFPEHTTTEKETPAPHSISVDENMMPVLDPPVTQSTQCGHPPLYATLSASSTLSRSKRMLSRSSEVPSVQCEEVVTGIPKDSRTDTSRVSIFMNDPEPKEANEDSDFMDELDQNLPADFQKEFISEAQSMKGLRYTFLFETEILRLVNH